MAEKFVVAYSSGLDTSVMIKEEYGYDVVTLTADVGQADDLAEVEKKAN
jgi:argininosuccinate synthase